MQGKPVRHSLHALREAFRTLHMLREPNTFKGDDNAADDYAYAEGEEGIPPD
jgi:hypothetical protein